MASEIKCDKCGAQVVTTEGSELTFASRGSEGVQRADLCQKCTDETREFAGVKYEKPQPAAEEPSEEDEE